MDGVVVEHRRLLVAELIDLRDRVGSDALRDEIAARLRDVGVEELSVTQGEMFDASRHRGVDTVPVGDPGWNQRVASTERPGYSDAGQVLRPPEVTVYRYEQS
jgi:molecular chaperone GrpE (heat shock protein)